MEKSGITMLPSRKFVLILTTCAIAVLGTLYISSRFGTQDSFSRSEYSVKNANITLEEAITLDSNNNGIADWEESLWGLDPLTNGPENKRNIEAKKTQAGIPLVQEETEVNSETKTTETEQFSKNLLATVLALKENGGLTPEAIANLGNAFGQNIDAKRSLIPAYTLSSFTITSDTTENYAAYDRALRKIIATYDAKKLGTEVDYIPQVMADGDTQKAQKTILTLGGEYQNFAKELIALPTPKGIAEFALPLANSADSIGVALQKIANIKEDALGGMIGVDEYTTNSENFLAASSDLTTFLTKIGE
jgi:hypothetical protein